MPKPISHYVLAKTQLSNLPARIAGENYGSAIIYFTPKIGEKNVDIKSLNCEFVQIIDRGEWGKEEVNFAVEASSASNRKYRQFFFENDGDSYELKFIPPAGLKLGIIEVYFDPDSTLENQFSMSGSFNNPIQVPAPDLTPVVAAIQAGTAASVAATQQAASAINPAVKAVVDTVYNAKMWTTKAEQHIALAPDPNRIGGTIFNKGTVRVAIDRFMDIANRIRDPQHDGFIEPGGTYNLSLEDAIEGVLLYTIPQTSAQVIAEQQLAISVELKAIP